MGMSASQARLLSITARLTNNEFRAQTITNSKLRLAEKSEEASSEYMDALNSKNLVFATYNETGDRDETPLTANLLFTYADLKNQYSIVNSSGKILVSSTDAQNYKNAESFGAFLGSYGIPFVQETNKEYNYALQRIFGSDYEKLMAEYEGTTREDAIKFINDTYINNLTSAGTNIVNLFNPATIGTFTKAADYQAIINNITNTNGKGILDSLNENSVYKSLSGYSGSYFSKISNPPVWNFGDRPENPPIAPTKGTAPDFSSLATSYNSSQCYDSVKPDIGGIGHMEHNLAALIWGTNGLANGAATITNSDGTIKITKGNAVNESSVSLTNYTNGPKTTQASKELAQAFKDSQSYDCVSSIMRNLVDLYCDVVNILDTGTSTIELDSSRVNIKSTAAKKSPSDLYDRWQDFYNNLHNIQASLDTEIDNEYNQQIAQYNIDKAAFDNSQKIWDNKKAAFMSELTNWLDGCNKLQKELLAQIGKIPEQIIDIPDKTDARYQWYTNLWYRMGQGDEHNKNYEVINDNLLTNSEWLEFALEHGAVTLEQARFSENGSDIYKGTNVYSDPGMGSYDWVSIPYTNAADIISKDDDVAVAVAEVKYKKTMTELENKDKKFDQDLKRLDAEHSALQTKYDSIKEVISKNVDRTFKAFS